MKSNFGECMVECEEGHIWTHKPEGGGYFRLSVILSIMKSIMDPQSVCDECGRPFYKVTLKRHLNGKGTDYASE